MEVGYEGETIYNERILRYGRLDNISMGGEVGEMRLNRINSKEEEERERGFVGSNRE